jgi:hypothetical protein
LPQVRIGTVSPSTSDDYLRDRRLVYQPYKMPLAGLEALENGQIDAMVYDAPLLRYLVLQHSRDKLEVLRATFERQDYAIAQPSNSPPPRVDQPHAPRHYSSTPIFRAQSRQGFQASAPAADLLVLCWEHPAEQRLLLANFGAAERFELSDIGVVLAASGWQIGLETSDRRFGGSGERCRLATESIKLPACTAVLLMQSAGGEPPAGAAG